MSKFAARRCRGPKSSRFLSRLPGDSPLSKVPPFCTLHQRYPVEDLAESLADGIRTAHPAMPEFELDQRQMTT
jgi:hypothetical protein